MSAPTSSTRWPPARVRSRVRRPRSAASTCCRGRRSISPSSARSRKSRSSRIQKISGANLARNWAMIPHVTQHEDADITEMEAFRKQLGAENKELKISPLVFQIKAVVAALKQFPAVQRLAGRFRREVDPQEIFPHRHRGGYARWPGRAGDPRLRQEGPARPRPRAGRDLEEGARQEARPGRNVRRLLLDQLARRYRRHLLHADRQRAGGGHPRGLQSGDEAGMERQGIRAAD